MKENLKESVSAALAEARQGTLELAKVLALSDRLNAAGQLDQSIMLYRMWIEHTESPMALVAYFNLGATLSSAGDDLAAEQSYRQAIALKPDFIQAYLNLGTVLERLGRDEEALEQWRKVLDFPVPEDKALYSHALNNLGRLLEIKHQFFEAEQMLERSLLLDPSQAPVVHHWVHLRQKQCKWPVFSKLNGLEPDDLSSKTSALCMLGLSDDPAMQLAAAHRFVDDKVNVQADALCNANGYGHKKLRIGYLSSNFNIHAVSLLTVELYELHDRDRVEVYGFCWSGEDTTPYRARIANAMDHYIRIADISDEEAAKCIRSHEIDILVDLQGLTSGARPNILSARPAPIQISYLGFPGTTGLPCNDYVIADEFVLPEALVPYFSEKPLYMPNSFQVCDRGRLVGRRPTRVDCGLPEDGFVFCSFNNNYKFTPEVFSTWMRILTRVPNSVLWLLADNQWAKENLCKFAEQHGIKRERLIFAPRVSPPDYLARYQAADLFLDTCPFNGGTTANDALWMGLPLLTCSGRTFASRMAGSLLKAVDLPELITYNLQDYEDKAVSLANDHALIDAMKRQLIDNRSSCALFDTPRFVKDLENLFFECAALTFKGSSMATTSSNTTFAADEKSSQVKNNVPLRKFLHVGCGPQTKESTVAVFASELWQEVRFDIDQSCNPDIIGTMTDMSMIKAGEMNGLYSAHNVEHLYPHEVSIALSEFHRVLDEHGFAVITCPDMKSVCQKVVEQGLTEPLYISPAGPIAAMDVMYGLRTAIASGKTYMAHRCGFTKDLLAQLLYQAGFRRVFVIERPENFDLWAIAFKYDVPEERVTDVMNEIFFGISSGFL